MSVLDSDRVDFVASKGAVVQLVMTDHLSWDDVEEHMLALQDKINAYIAFVESGQIDQVANVPPPGERQVIVSIVLKEPAALEVEPFFGEARRILGEIGVGLEIRVHEDKG
jgi:hypothetical protein